MPNEYELTGDLSDGRKLLAQEGNRVELGGGKAQVQQLVCEWLSQDGLATDLELLVQPFWGLYPLTSPPTAGQVLTTLQAAFWAVEWQHGVGGFGGVGSHDTRARTGQQYRTEFGLPADVLIQPTPGPSSPFRAAGIRARFTATAAKVWAIQYIPSGGPANDAVPITASLAPASVAGDTWPKSGWFRRQLLTPYNTRPALFPIGATEWRVTGNPALTVEELDPAGALIQSTLAANLGDWTPIHARALSWQCSAPSPVELQATYR